jgi:hypothetical protein
MICKLAERSGISHQNTKTLLRSPSPSSNHRHFRRATLPLWDGKDVVADRLEAVCRRAGPSIADLAPTLEGRSAEAAALPGPQGRTRCGDWRRRRALGPSMAHGVQAFEQSAVCFSGKHLQRTTTLAPVL